MTSASMSPRRRERITLAGLCILAAAVRLYKISEPYVDQWSFKQGTIAIIAENFYRHGFHLLYPQINWAGAAPGYIGTEFPLVPFLASLLYIPLGVHEWIGRSVPLVFSVLSLPFFYLLVKKTSNERSAAFAAFIYAVIPLSVFAGRSFMSDAPALSFAVIGIYLFTEWLDRSDRSWLFAAGFLIALTILVKLPNVIVGVPLLYLAWEKYGSGFWRRRELWAFAVLALGLPAAWYLHAFWIKATYPPHQFAGSDGVAFADLDFYLFVARRLLTSMLTPVVAAAAVAGLFVPAGRYGRVFHWWLGALILFVIIAGHGNRHPWYQLPAVPIAAACAGRLFDFLLRKVDALSGSKIVEWSAAGVLSAAVAVFSYAYARELYEPWAVPLMEGGNAIERIASPDGLVIFVVDGDSSAIYYSKHKGWHAFDESDWGEPLDDKEAIAGLEKLRDKGAGYLLFTRDTVWWLDYYGGFGRYLNTRYRREAETDNYVIFDLRAAASRPSLASRRPVAMGCGGDEGTGCSQKSH